MTINYTFRRNWLNHGFIVGALVMSAAMVGCSGGDEVEHGSGAICPTGSTITYQNFAKDFMSRYCLSCHSTSLAGNTRNGAPAAYNFDTYELILASDVEEIDAEAASGLSRTNTEMPPAGHITQPTKEERHDLGEWIACGLPQ